MDDDSNFLSDGTPELYFLTVDDINKTITLKSLNNYKCEFEHCGSLALVLLNWSWDSPVASPLHQVPQASGPVALTNTLYLFYS
jgi:hypothetical protein